MYKKRLTVEEIINLAKDRDELKRLRQIKRNLQSGVVFDVSPELMELLETKQPEEL